MLQLSHDPRAISLPIEDLTQMYLDLDFPRKFEILQNFMPNHVNLPKVNPPYDTFDFPEGSRQVISMLSFFLGYVNDEFTDASIFGFLSTLSPGQQPELVFDFAKFIADNIHYQLIKLPDEGVFRYTSYLLHLFLFSQAYNFPIAVQKMDMEGQPHSVIFWTSLLRKNSSEYSYSDFNDLFIKPDMSLLDKAEPPRINEEIKRILQLSENCKVGEWYLYKNHT